MKKNSMQDMDMSSMCDVCIGIKVTGDFDPQTEYTRTCEYCGTVWAGQEKTERHRAIREQKARHG
jgi:hypothetical protein